MRRYFGISLPHMDTADEVMRILPDESRLEKLRTELITVLINRKIFRKYRLLGKYSRV